MPKPRKQCVCLEATPYYHCISRCVRRVFLCGIDHNTGQSYEHRRDWIQARIIELTQIFAIEVCAYAVMSNHYHIVLKVNAQTAKNWSMREVLERWTALFSGPRLIQQYLNKPSQLMPTQRVVVDELTEVYRQRLADLSWFMRCLNEPIARQANAEDHCSGHFWESRFKSQALLDEAALLSAMAYVDLNPIRAGMATTPETSDFTSVQARIKTSEIEQHLLTFCPSQHAQEQSIGIPFSLADYLELVDWTGRAIRHNKRGFIPSDAPPIFVRLNIDSKKWLEQQPLLEKHYPNFMGTIKSLEQACQQFKRKWIKGKQHAKLLFG